MTGSRGTTPLSARLGRIIRAHAEADRTGVPVDDVLGREPERQHGVSRRDALIAGGAIGAGAALAMATPAHAAVAKPGPAPKVVIVGAGLAGVRAAHWLWRVKGIAATIYEGSARAGGRCYSLRGHFDDGIVVEHGGALINTDHNATRNLAANLGLSLDVVAGGSYQGWDDKYWIDGADYPYDDANADWGVVYQAFKSALASAPYCQTYDDHTAAGVALDQLNVDQWLAANVPGGLSSRFAKLMQSNVMSEYGLEPHEQSALSLIYLLGWNAQNSLSPVNGADEKYSVNGGNDLIVSRMLEELPANTVRYGYKLTAVKRNADGTVRLSFQVGNTTVDQTADRAILALPFTTLRDCDLSQSGFSALKRRAINEVGLGANAKVHVQVSHRPWVEQGYGGAAYTNKSGFQCGWDDTADHPLPTGVFNFFPSGDQVKAWTGNAFGPASASQVNGLLAQAEPIFPGMTAAYTGKSYRDFWWANPWSKGSYTVLRPGQYTTLFGAGSTPEGNVHFAGEHTSVEYFGFLNGAVVSGERAAKAVAA
ncbi:monoamine oxidase [Agromyces hippuratus]|uniref:Monoamine oxidase n=1 Tax=Agromyces hippuratus TaxID=286438 RepID=A0A852WTY0_9MICO|nr:FAD-dependent oxidoreductase [Agromyces hippuratus]NYG19423.1 monoamine oxidase [Agromyces hippuratus]